MKSCFLAVVAIAAVTVTGCGSTEPDGEVFASLGDPASGDGYSQFGPAVDKLLEHVRYVEVSAYVDRTLRVMDGGAGTLDVVGSTRPRVQYLPGRDEPLTFHGLFRFTANVWGSPSMEIREAKWNCKDSWFYFTTNNLLGWPAEQAINRLFGDQIPSAIKPCPGSPNILDATAPDQASDALTSLLPEFRAPSVEVWLSPREFELDIPGRPLRIVSEPRQGAASMQVDISLKGTVPHLRLDRISFDAGGNWILAEPTNTQYSRLAAVRIGRMTVIGAQGSTRPRIEVWYALHLNAGAPSRGYRAVFEIRPGGSVVLVHDDRGEEGGDIRALINTQLSAVIEIAIQILYRYDGIIPGYSLSRLMGM